jgi:CBS-domain-containing membrane protein
MTTTMTGTVASVMTRCPISVPVGASFATVAAVLTHNRISAVPVLDQRGCPVGVVSEGDLLGGPRDAGLTARYLMTSPVRTVDVDATLAAASRLLADAGVRRLFVTEHDRLVGVLSRRDLLKTYLLDDDTIRDMVRQALLPLPLSVSVEDGVVLLLGRVEWHSTRTEVEERVLAVPGVIEVRNRLGYVFDDGAAHRGRRLARSTR